ncbi:MAG: hypothetical protein ACM3WV_12245 [Bacillota bacterium]
MVSRLRHKQGQGPLHPHDQALSGKKEIPGAAESLRAPGVIDFAAPS